MRSDKGVVRRPLRPQTLHLRENFSQYPAKTDGVGFYRGRAVIVPWDGAKALRGKGLDARRLSSGTAVAEDEGRGAGLTRGAPVDAVRGSAPVKQHHRCGGGKDVAPAAPRRREATFCHRVRVLACSLPLEKCKKSGRRRLATPSAPWTRGVIFTGAHVASVQAPSLLLLPACGSILRMPRN